MLIRRTVTELAGGHGWYYYGRMSCGAYFLDTNTSYPLPDNWRIP